MVVIKHEPPDSGVPTTLNHELHQVHTFGVLQPILYLLASLVVWAAGDKVYKGNVFESAARRAAGQIVDIDSFVQGFALGKKTGQK